jgi:hypothetical protein
VKDLSEGLGDPAPIVRTECLKALAQLNTIDEHTAAEALRQLEKANQPIPLQEAALLVIRRGLIRNIRVDEDRLTRILIGALLSEEASLRAASLRVTAVATTNDEIATVLRDIAGNDPSELLRGIATQILRGQTDSSVDQGAEQQVLDNSRRTLAEASTSGGSWYKWAMLLVCVGIAILVWAAVRGRGARAQ